ncbi:hypothetical protein ScPMuIL_014563 [Solemya velum]
MKLNCSDIKGLSLPFYIVYIIFVQVAFSTSYRGGTIRWQPVPGSGNKVRIARLLRVLELTGFWNKVRFDFQLGFGYGLGPNCTTDRKGQLAEPSSKNETWNCYRGCSETGLSVGPLSHHCTFSDQKRGWEQGANSFIHAFAGRGPFEVGHEGMRWPELSTGNTVSTKLETWVDLRTRSDTDQPNSSPFTASEPVHDAQFGCPFTLDLLLGDPDGDIVRCRWAVGAECLGSCQTLPEAKLHQDNCTIQFLADGIYVADGWYAVTLTVEDFPRNAISRGNMTYTQSDALSAIPLQFMVHVVEINSSCGDRPVFVSGTARQGTVLMATAGSPITPVMIHATNIDTTVG